MADRSPDRPTTVTLASVIWILISILGLVLAVVLFIVFTSVAGAQSGGRATLLVLLAVGQLVVAIVQLVVVVRMRRGANWARVVLTALAIATIAAYVPQALAQPATWIGIAVLVLAVVLMFVGGANAWFARRRA